MEKPSFIKRFFSFLLKVLVVFFFMVVFAAASFEGVTFYLTGSFYNYKKAIQDNNVKKAAQKEETTAVKNTDNANLENTVLFVKSYDGLSEYMILNLLNKKTKALDVLLIPQNAQVQVSGDILKEIHSKMGDTGKIVNLADVSRIFGDKSSDMICKIFEQIFAIKIEGYDTMSAEQAADFLDMTKREPITLNDTLSYRDTKGILQFIEKGDVEITSAQAMHYMMHLDGSSEQESKRLVNCSTYLEKFLDDLLQTKKAGQIMKKYRADSDSSEGRSFDHIEKDLKEMSGENISIRILQGSEKDKVFAIDSQKAQLQIASLIKQGESYSRADALNKDSDDVSSASFYNDGDEAESSKSLAIELYNSAYVSGLAGDWDSYLSDQGYNITLVGTYQEEGPLSQTRIIVKKDDVGRDLLKYFPNAEISVGNIDTGGDIQVYIGTDSTDVGVNSSADETEDTADETESTAEETDSSTTETTDTETVRFDIKTE